MEDIGKQIAKAALEIKAITLSPDDPYTWASGYRMPIYNDNRRLLNSYEHRMLVANGFKDTIQSENIPVDYILGTSTAGIAPATSIADLLKVPLIIMEEGKAYHCKTGITVGTKVGYDVVASTCPWAIPHGVYMANDKQLPFMYVRQSKKGHGLKQQIEGIPEEGKKALLVDFYKGESYFDDAVKALLEKGVTPLIQLQCDFTNLTDEVSIEGKNVLVIEDLMSTGGSSAKEVQSARDAGGIVNYILSIFNYGLDKAVQAFGSLAQKCEVRSLLIYDVLLDVAKETGDLIDEQVKLLGEWRADPFNWGEKHGFPKVEK
ncbi:hypothetical protein KY342_06525 [Candidatus Woesearchaeota archaeon]|nr:hypothetical protein [Candidatus Woesearchaeota archaeon]